jgi:hypothetical protein
VGFCCSGGFRFEALLDEVEILLLEGSCEGFIDLSQSSNGHECVWVVGEGSLIGFVRSRRSREASKLERMTTSSFDTRVALPIEEEIPSAGRFDLVDAR